MAEAAAVLMESIYLDLIPMTCFAELFGMDHVDDRMNSLVMGVWQGAVRYYGTVKEQEIAEALRQDRVKDLFHRTTHTLADRGQSYALKLKDKLGDVSFRLHNSADRV